MKILTTKLEGLFIIEPRVFRDARGYFYETWNKERYIEAGIPCDFVQDNESKSSYGVVRGLHYQQRPYSQAKLVRVVLGEVLDVVVDIRKGSPTFGQYESVRLSDQNKRQLFIPRGFAHGFSVLSSDVVFSYKCDHYYRPDFERGISFSDPEIGIDWGIPADQMILSEKDKRHPVLAEAEIL